MRCTPHKILFGDEIKKNEMGGRIELIQNFGGGTCRQETTWKT
jgi:hypothetical protein